MKLVEYIKKGVRKMKFRIIKKALSILIAVVMLIPAGIMTAVPADAASNIANITIDAVTRKYKEAASFLQLQFLLQGPGLFRCPFQHLPLLMS